ncbi:MAG TPA: hypothetical protein VM737_04465 [Gemmatimonadota bacterium]|nr:hypothetical protein [Gemmatimonadota bacterium]
MPRRGSLSVRSFLLELAIYAVLVVGYFYLALLLLADWLTGLHDRGPYVYAVTALALIVGQGVLLESLTRALIRLTQRWR